MLGESVPRITELCVGFTYWERHGTILPLRDAGVVTKCFVCVVWVTGSYFLNGMCFIYDTIRWKPSEKLLANFISVSLSLFTVFLFHNPCSSVLSKFFYTFLTPPVFTTAEVFL